MDQQEISNMNNGKNGKEKVEEKKWSHKSPGVIIPKDRTFIRVTTAEDRRDSEVMEKKKSGKAKNVCKPVKDMYRFKLQVEKAGLVRPGQGHPQTIHCTGQDLRVIRLRWCATYRGVMLQMMFSEIAGRETECIYQAVKIDLPIWKSVSSKTILDKWSRNQGILRWRKTKRKFINLQILSRRDTKEVLLRQGSLDNWKLRQSNWGLQEDKVATKETTWAPSPKPAWFPPTSIR